MSWLKQIRSLFSRHLSPTKRRWPWPVLRLDLLEDRVCPSTVYWNDPADGDWNTASNWLDNQGVARVPGSGDNVVINQTGIAVTYSGGSDSINSLMSNAALTLTGGTLTVAQTMQVNNVFTIAGGTLQDATVMAGTGGQGITLTDQGGTLDGDTTSANLDLATNNGANVHIVNDLTLNNATVYVGNAAGSTYGQLYFDDNETLGGTGTVVFGKSSSNTLYETLYGGGTLTIGPDVTVRGSSGILSSYYVNDTIINQGIISADDSGGVVPGFVYDTGFSDGNPTSTAATITTSGVTNPAPQAVYQTARQGYSFSYALANLTAGSSYTVQLDFADINGASAGEQQFDVGINGNQVLSNFDIAATAGGLNTAVDEAFTSTADSTGTITINFSSGSGNYASVNGIEVLSGSTLVQAIDCGLQAGGTFTVNPGTFQNQGTLSVSNGENLNVTGSLIVTGQGADFNVAPGSKFNLDGSLTMNGSAIVGGQVQISITGNLLGNTQNADLFATAASVNFDGSGNGSSPQYLEAMSLDEGDVAAGFHDNFAYANLNIANNTYVKLVDQSRNSPASGTNPEALYVDNLSVGAGTTFDLGGLHVYARFVQIDGTIYNGQVTQLAPGGPLVLNSSASGYLTSAAATTWTFFGRANQQVSVLVNPGDPNNPPSPLPPTLSYVQVQILDSNGNVIASGVSTQAGADVDLLGVTLPTDGTCQVVVSVPNTHSTSTGNYTIGVFDAANNSYPLSLGQNVTGQLSSGYDVDNWNFTAQANAQVQFNLLGASSSGLRFDLIGPNGYTAFSGAVASSGLITLPATGTYTLIVHAVQGLAGAYAFHLTETNETPLTLGTPFDGTLQGSDQAELFTVNVPHAGNPLVVNLADPSSADQDELYLQFGSAPSRSVYQYRYSNLAAANQQILVPSAAPGTWYILLYGNNVPAPSSYTLSAASESVVLTGISPNRSSTIASTLITLTGAGFNNSTTVQLVAANGTTTYAASAVQVNSPTQVGATFSANAVPAGTYSVEVLNAGGTPAMLPGAFTMVQGGQANLVTNLILPNPMGRHIASIIYVQYSNTGTAPMPAPMLVLTGTNPLGQQGTLMTLNPALQNSGFWTSAVPEGYSTSVQFLASGATPGVLEPGESETIPVYYAGWLTSQWDFTTPELYFTVGVITGANTTTIGWNTPGMQASLQPPGMPAAAWAALYGVLTVQIGPTWGDYVQRLDQDAAYLGSLGENVSTLTQLWSFEVQQANGFNPVMDLSMATDMTVQVPGLPLSISRTFSSDLDARNLLGPFGNGWVLSGGWGQTLAVQSDGSVDITNAYGSESIYQPDTQYAGAYFSQPGNYNTLANPAAGVYTLTAPDGQVTEFVNGAVAYIQDADGNRITAGYTNGLLTSLTDSSVAWIDFTYNSAGRITALTNSEGQKTTYAYDPSNQHLLSVTQYQSATDTVGYTTSYTYSGSTNPVFVNALLSVTNPDGSQQNFGYDADGRLSETSANGGAQAVQYAYGIGGTVSATTAASADGPGGTTTYYFDNRGMLLKMVDPLGNATYYSYDSSGNLVQVTDPAGQNYDYQYDSQGNLIQATNPLGYVTRLTYGALDTLTSVTDPNGNTSQYQHDQNGNLTATIFADGTVEKNAFNPIGELLQSTDGNKKVANYTYNSAGQILSKTYSDGTQTTFVYDPYGNLVSATNAAGTTTLTYDSANRLIEIQYPDDTSLTYTYNAAGQRLTMNDQTGYTVSYAYNTLGQLTGLSDSSGPIVTYTYDSAGRLSEQVKGNGTYTQYTYDADGNILSLINYAPGGAVNSSFVYTYNDLGLNTTETTIDGQWVYTYDPIDQLTQAVFTPNNTDPDGIASQNLQYFYDANGNRTESITNGVVTTYTTNDMNQYTSTTTVGLGVTTYQYDGNGNLISEAAPTGTTSYTFNIANQLTGIQAPGATSSFQYDVFGNLYSATQNGQQTRYLANPLGGNIIGQFTTGGTVIAHYTYGLGLVSQINAAGTPVTTISMLPVLQSA